MKRAYVTMFAGIILTIASLFSLLWINSPHVFRDVVKETNSHKKFGKLIIDGNNLSDCDFTLSIGVPFVNLTSDKPYLHISHVGNCDGYELSLITNFVSVSRNEKLKEKRPEVFQYDGKGHTGRHHYLITFNEEIVVKKNWSDHQTTFLILVRNMPPIKVNRLKNDDVNLEIIGTKLDENYRHSFLETYKTVYRNKYKVEEKTTLNIVLSAILAIGISAFFEALLTLTIIDNLNKRKPDKA